MHQITKQHSKWIVGLIMWLFVIIAILVASPKTEASVITSNTTYNQAISHQMGETQTGLQPSASWLSDDDLETNSVAWGDINNDGYLDLARGGSYGVQLHINDKGVLPQTYQTISSDRVQSVAWGDMNNDGYLDLAVGRGGHPESFGYENEVYLNNKQGFLTAAWSGEEADNTTSVAWGDVNGDSYLDLAVGNYRQVNKVYLNNRAGSLQSTPLWIDGVTDDTQAILWGDVNEDGKLDLIVGNGAYTGTSSFNKVYLNNGAGSLQTTPAWTDNSNDTTQSLAWDDMDGDGLKDLAVGNRGYNKVYLNEKNGTLSQKPSWTAAQAKLTYAVFWGDVNNDGGLDLVAGNWSGVGEPNDIYLNKKGVLETEAARYSNDRDDTFSLALGDMNNDGFLDLAVGNQGGDAIYLNKGDIFVDITHGKWQSNSDSNSVAWGDMNNDGYLDVAVSGGTHGSGPDNTRYGFNKVYLNNREGTLQSAPAWTAAISNVTYSVAWGDMDNDGYLDLAVGNGIHYRQGIPNNVYLNKNGLLQSTPVWTSADADATRSVAWGDMNGDGYLDLAVGSDTIGGFKYHTKVYLNQKGMLLPTPVWTSTERDVTFKVAWGDMDNDGDLDLATGNYSGYGATSNKVYLNVSGMLQSAPVWSAPSHSTHSVAWGDMNNDGYLDLAVGNSGYPNQVYLNKKGILQYTPIWSAHNIDDTRVIAWGDIDGDNDLDLAVGNWGNNTIYLNEKGQLQNLPIYSFAEEGGTQDMAWGDIDNDDNLDLLVANIIYRYNTTNQVYINKTIAPYLKQKDVPLIHSMFFNYQNQNLYIPINYTLAHPESIMVKKIEGMYSFDKNDWQPALPTDNTPLKDLTTSPNGTMHTFTWSLSKTQVVGENNNVEFRLRAILGEMTRTNHTPGPYLYSPNMQFENSLSIPFVTFKRIRVYSDTKVSGNEVANALVFRGNTQYPDKTNKEGYLQGRGEIMLGDQLMALYPVTWTEKYTLYHTNATLIANEVVAHTATDDMVQELVVSKNHPLYLFNLDVSVEWDASHDGTYLDTLTEDLKRTSEILYDLSNGGMALGKIHLYHNKEKWNESDIVIYANNKVRPNADIGGFLARIKGGVLTEAIQIGNNPTTVITYNSGQVRMGSTWTRFGTVNSSLSEDWSRVLAHELGHYLFVLQDNYFGFTATNVVIGQDCKINSKIEYDVMSDPYRVDASEFLTIPCENSLAEKSTGRSDWDTLVKFYDALKPLTPTIPISGPNSLPLNVTQIITINTPLSVSSSLRPYVYLSYEADYQPNEMNKRVGYLIKTRNTVDDLTDDDIMNLGTPNRNGVYAPGVAKNDQVCVFDYGQSTPYIGCTTMQDDTNQDNKLKLQPVEQWPPDISMVPLRSTTDLTTLVITVTANPVFSPSTTIFAQVLTDGKKARIIPLRYQPQQTAPDKNVFAAEIELPNSITHIFAKIWVEGSKPYTQITQLSWHGDWPWDDGCGRIAQDGYSGCRAPIYADDGGFVVFSHGDEIGSIQTINQPPQLDSWLKPVGNVYRVFMPTALTNTNKTTDSLLFSYLERDVPMGQEQWLHIYSYTQKSGWQRLPQVYPDQTRNIIAAQMLPMTEPTMFALMSTVPIQLNSGWNDFGYVIPTAQGVITAMASISDAYSIYGYNSISHSWMLHDSTVLTNFDQKLEINNLTDLEFIHGYWVHVKEPVTMYLSIGNKASDIANLLNQPFSVSPHNLPTPSALYYGEITVTDKITPTDKITLTAKINGNDCSDTLKIEANKNSPGNFIYKLKVKPPVECQANKTMVDFLLNGKHITSTEWSNYQANYLPLDMSIPITTSDGAKLEPICANWLVNGDMEQNSGWTFGGAVTPTYTTTITHSGKQSLMLGSTQLITKERWSEAYQVVKLPQIAKSMTQTITLTFQYQLQASDIITQDKRYILILDKNNFPLTKSISKVDEKDKNQWLLFEANLTPYHGQTIEIYLGVRDMADGGTTQMYVDDVSLCVDKPSK